MSRWYSPAAAGPARDRAAYLAWGAALGTGTPGEQVAADELKFLDPSRTRAYVIEEHMTTR